MPLVTDREGRKFGKSEGNALWLDKNKTSSYEIYQYLINSDDEKVIDYLKVFTFLTKEEIEELARKNSEHPEEREAHKALAREVITFIHGEEEYEKAKMMSEALFNEDITKLSATDIISSLKDIPKFDITEDINLVDLLVNSNICTSKREAREFILNGAIAINNKKVIDLDKVVTKKDSIDDKIVIIKKGKKKYYLGFYK
jgi:tyrosyl-tRNA synthetase